MKARYIFTLLLIISFALPANAQQVTPVTSKEVPEMLKKDKKLVILDVRTPAEFSQGYIKGAINMNVADPDAFERYSKLDKNAKYVVICRTRNRSGVVTNYMVQNGFKTVYQVTDGMVGWNMNGLPLEK
jgi:rhodanese-related sulfurtransferase